MTSLRLPLFLVLPMTAAACVATSSHAAVVLDDPFDDADITNGIDPLDTAWYSVNDSAAGNPLWNVRTTEGNPPASLGHFAFTADKTFVVGDFPGAGSFTLANPGDFVTISMDVQDANDDATGGNTSDDAAQTQGGRTFDLYLGHNNGTLITANEIGTLSDSADDPTVSVLSISNKGGGLLADGDLHALEVTLTVNASGDLERSVSVDGVVQDGTAGTEDLTGTIDLATTELNRGFGSAGAPLTDINQLSIRWRTQDNNVSAIVDNIVVAFVPEPGSMILLGAGSLLLFRRRDA